VRALVAALAALLLLPAAALADPPGSASITTGEMTATLTWAGNEPGVSNARLSISRAGVPAFDQPIPDVVCDHCTPLGYLLTSDLEGDSDPEVIVVSDTTGLDCCRQAGFYSFFEGRYDELEHDFGPVGFEPVDIDGDGDVELVSADARFDEVYTSHTYSHLPPQVLMYLHQDGVPILVDVTSGYPSEPMDNATEAKRLLTKRRFKDVGEARSIMAAYVADQYLLERGATGRRELDRQIRRGVLGRPASARAYKRQLLRLLRRYGYA
jgi:hypothetical protein